MISITSFTLVLSILAGVLVGAIPQHQQRDDPVCVDRTITVTAPSVSGPTPLPDSNEQPAAGLSENEANAVVTVTRTVTVVRTTDSVPETTSDDGVTETVTITSTETSTVTIHPLLETQIAEITTEPQESPNPEPAAPLPPIVLPHFVNATQSVPFGNSSLPSNDSSSGLPKPPSAVGIAPPSEYALPVPSGYENSLYFTNWSVTLPLLSSKEPRG